MSAPPDCPCEILVHPRIISNPPGRAAIDYRAGDYPSFRQALLRARDGEIALAHWHPTAGSDLALQMLEWWAYLADVLTFYNERAMQEVLLRTAVLPEDVRRIIRLLGYRPRPGIGATGVVAALTDTTRPFVLPRGFSIGGVSAPGQPAQIFELDDDIEIGMLGRPLPPSARFPAISELPGISGDTGIPGGSGTPDGSGTPGGGTPGGTTTPASSGDADASWRGPAPRDDQGRLADNVPANVPPDPTLKINAGDTFKVTLDGVVATIKPNDVILLLKRDWDGTPYPDSPNLAGPRDPFMPPFIPPTSGSLPSFVLSKVSAVRPFWNEAGHAVTEVTALSAYALDAAALRKDYRILRPTKLAHLWLYHDRYPGSTSPEAFALSTAGQVVGAIGAVLTGGLFGSLPPTQPRQDPRVLAGVATQGDGPPHGVAHLEAITRGISAGDPVLFEQRIAVDPSTAAGFAGGGLLGMFAMIENLLGRVDQPALAALRAPLTQLVKVTGYTEEIWYANAPQMDRIGQGPPVGPPGNSGGMLGGLVGGLTGGLLGGGGAEGPIPIPHSRITFQANPFLDAMAADGRGLKSIVVHYGWQEVGQIVPAPAPGPTTTVDVPRPPAVPSGAPVPVLIADATSDGGAYGWLGGKGIPVGAPGVSAGAPGVDGGAPGAGGGVPGAGGAQPRAGDLKPLVPPLRALLNLLPVSRGETVEPEILGSGDPILIGQEFVLRRSPLTYLTDTGPRSINGYRSTLRIRVDGIEWREVASFYGQPADARVFVTREDDQQKTHVRFGDGENGARLPAGTDNVVARYRAGSGAAVPPAGTLTSILRPQTGLKAIVNPVAVGGGADPDPPEQIRRYAPRSVLTFGRAISGDDYETVAAQTPGVRRARVNWSWDGPSQRTLVKVFVGDDAAAVAAATAALRAFGDPNRPVVVRLAAPIYPDLRLTLEVDPAYQRDTVAAAVVAALSDPGSQPFGFDVVQIGQIVYDSHIYDACLRVPGVTAVHGLRFGIWTREIRRTSPPLGSALPTSLVGLQRIANASGLQAAALRSGGIDQSSLNDRLFPFRDVLRVEYGERHSPGEGSFYLLRGDRLHVAAEMARHGE